MTRAAQPPDDGRIIIEDETLRGGFTQIPNAILGRQDLSPGAKLAYMGLLSFAWQSDSCFPGQEKLADHLGVGKRSVIRYLQDLQDAGLLRIERRGLGRTNVYYLPRVVSPHGRSANLALPEMPKSAHPEVPNLHIEEYEVETDSEEEDSGYISNRDIALSKFRKGQPRKFEADRLAPDSRPADTSQTIAGFHPAAVLVAEHPLQTRPRPTTQRAESRKKAPAPGEVASETIPPTFTLAQAVVEAQERGRASRLLPAAQPGKTRYAEDRALVLAYLRDYASEFHDLAPLKSSVTRALHLLQRSGLPEERWTGKLYEARNLTKEQAAAIGYQGKGKPRAGSAAAGLNKMPYFFGVLECVLGLHDHPAGQHPLPLTAAEFQRQQRSRGAGRRSQRTTDTTQAPLPEAQPGTETSSRPSLAGRFSHLVER